MSEIKPTNCHFCGYCCAFLATVEEGRVVDLKPDPSRYPYDERILAGCRRWRMNLDVLDSPRRVNYPLRRVGKRGSGKWERVSWDDALDDIAARLAELRAQHGAGTLASAIGGPHASFWPLHRFMNLFGSPNNMGIGPICWNPRIWMDVITFGWTVEASIVPGLTKTFFLWGTNPAQSDNSAFWQTIRNFRSQGITLVVVDPRRTQCAATADLWLPVKPGTDCTLALGMAHVIIREDLIDHAFVEQWCHGFDELVEHVAPYTPEMVARTCGLDAQDVVAAARAFAAGPTALVSGRGIDQVGASVAPTHRALCILRAITGNLDRAGACVVNEASDFISEVDFELASCVAHEQRALCLNEGRTPLQCYTGYDLVAAQSGKFGRFLPQRYMTSVMPDFVWHAVETGEPYPIRALIVNATNPLVTYADTHRVYRALKSLDLLVVLDYYITPTAALADYVLPVAGAIERPILQIHGGVANIGYGGPAAVSPYYERKTDYDIFRALSERLGLGGGLSDGGGGGLSGNAGNGEDCAGDSESSAGEEGGLSDGGDGDAVSDAWPDPSLADAFATQLAPAHMSWEEYCERGIYAPEPTFNKHLQLTEAGTPQGFATTTGKVELASELLVQLGGQRLPEPGQTTSLCSEPLRRAIEAQGGVHLEMITGSRKQPYNASMYLENAEFRKYYPRPVAEMTEATATSLGLQAGDQVRLTTDYGEAVFTLAYAPMREGLINVDYGWWFPERGVPHEPDLGGIWESNVNTLTTCEPCEPLIGTWSYNAIDCMIQKVEE